MAEARPPMPASSALPALGVEKGQQGTEIAEVEEREALLIGVAEEQPEALLLGLVGLQHLGQELGAEIRDGGPHGDARSDAAEREELDGERRRREGHAELGGALDRRTFGRAGGSEAREVALDVGHEHRHAGARELFGDPLERLGLAGAGGSGHKPVAAHHAEGHRHHGLGGHGAVMHAAAEVESRPLRGVGRSDGLGEVGHQAAVCSDPQNAHLCALCGISLRHSGHSLTVGSAPFARRSASLFMGMTMMK